jgi:hypothetical protein
LLESMALLAAVEMVVILYLAGPVYCIFSSCCCC